jgi:mono/diheme cytochrome c family protein
MMVRRFGLAARRSLASVILLSLIACGGDSGGDEPSSAQTDLVAQGEQAFQANCATCHGTDLRGTETGPPFLDPVYAPDHHPDEAFFAAVENGVQPHHWDFGAMPPQPAVTEEEVRAIVAFVRSEQAAAGITSSSE